MRERASLYLPASELLSRVMQKRRDKVKISNVCASEGVRERAKAREDLASRECARVHQTTGHLASGRFGEPAERVLDRRMCTRSNQKRKSEGNSYGSRRDPTCRRRDRRRSPLLPSTFLRECRNEASQRPGQSPLTTNLQATFR